jgi:hypothetical protein
MMHQHLYVPPKIGDIPAIPGLPQAHNGAELKYCGTNPRTPSNAIGVLRHMRVYERKEHNEAIDDLDDTSNSEYLGAMLSYNFEKTRRRPRLLTTATHQLTFQYSILRMFASLCNVFARWRGRPVFGSVARWRFFR